MDTEKKLQLIRQLREDNLHNQMNARELTSLLDGTKLEQKHHFSSFRFRLFLSIIIMIFCFFFLKTDQTFHEKTLAEYFHYLTINQAEDILKQHGF